MRRVLIVVLLALACSLVGGTVAAGASTRIARNPVSAADWKIWTAMDADLVRLNHKISPQYAKCAALKRADAIGVCDAKPLSRQARRTTKYSSTIGDIAARSRPGQCRTALLRYELAIQATVSAAIVANKELILANKVLWKSALTLEKQIKHVLGIDRANAERLCKP